MSNFTKFKANINNGSIISIDILEAGSNFSNPPNIMINPPDDSNGNQAQAYCEIENGSLSNIIITDGGSGYLTEPLILDDSTLAGNNVNLQLHSGWDDVPTINNNDYHRIIGSHHLKTYLNTLRNDYELSILADGSSTIEFSYNGIINIFDNYDNFLYGSCSINSNPTLYTYNSDISCYGYKNGVLNGLLIQNLSSYDKIFKIIILS